MLVDSLSLRYPTSHSSNLLAQQNVPHPSAAFVPLSLLVSTVCSRLHRPALMLPVLGSRVDAVARRMVGINMVKLLAIMPIITITDTTRCIVSDTSYARRSASSS